MDGRPGDAAGAQHGDRPSPEGEPLLHGRGQALPVRVRAPEPPALVGHGVDGPYGAGVVLRLVEEGHDGPLVRQRHAHAVERFLPDHPHRRFQVFHAASLVAGPDPHGAEGRVDHQRREAVPHGVPEEGEMPYPLLHRAPSPFRICRTVLISAAVNCPGAVAAPSSRLA